MLRSQSSSLHHSLMQSKPRKMLKIDLIHQQQYNEFEGNSQIDQKQLQNNQNQQQNSNKKNKQIYNGMKGNKQFNQVQRKFKYTYQEQVNQNEKFYMMIKGQNMKFRKVGDQQKKNIKIKQNEENKIKMEKDNNIKKQNINVTKQNNQIKDKNMPKVKFEQGFQPIVEQIKQQQKTNKYDSKTVIKVKDSKQKSQKQIVKPSSNWSKFLSQSSLTKKLLNSSTPNTTPLTQPSKFISIDCQFVRCGQTQTLARVSIVSELCQTLYDSYIRPQNQITDYLTLITGITYSHIKNAPFWKDQIKKVKKIMINKILIGHTIHKDLQVMGLDKWTGISNKIDVAEFSMYKEKNGKKVASLKRLSESLLNKNIQKGWHSSVEDAVATMELFKINKKKIMKENKLI